MNNDISDYFGIIIDTSYFVEQCYKFNSPTLTLLYDLKKRFNIQLFLPDVVDFEIKKHIKQDCNEFYDKISKYHFIDISKDFGDKLILHLNKKYKKFNENLSTIILQSSSIDVSDVLKNYFEQTPPFSAKKKEEFPDAIALYEIKNLIQKIGKKVIVISKDSDWETFLKDNKNVLFLNNIPSVYTYFKISKEFDAKTIIPIISSYEFKEILESKFNQSTPNIDFLEPYGSLYITPEFEGYSVEDYKLTRDDIETLEKNENLYTIKINISSTLYCYCTFSSEIYDSIDKDFTPYNDLSKKIKIYFQTDIILSLEDKINTLILKDIELIDVPKFLNFGEIDPVSDDFYENIEENSI